MTRGKREAASSGWNRGGDPFANEPAPRRTSPGSHVQHEPPRSPARKKKKKKSGRGLLIAVIVLLCLVASAVAIKRAIVRKPDLNTKVDPTESIDKENALPSSGDTDKAETAKTPANGRKEDFYTFMVLGKDTASGSTDTILLISYDVKNQKVSCMSIPRDTCINVPWGVKKINSVYSRKESSGGKIPGMREQIGKLTGVTPDYYVVIEWKAVGELIKALGGITMNVPYNMDYDDPYQDLHIHQKKGERRLSPSDAMQVVRWRQNNDGTNYGDTARVQIQQDFMKAVAKECLQLKNIAKIKDFAQIFSDNVKTDLPMSNLLWFAEQAMSLDLANIQFMTMPTYQDEFHQYAHVPAYGSYLFAIPEEMVKMVNEHFNPYTEDLTQEDLEIMVKNKNGSISLTSGTLADPKLAKAPAKKPKPSKPKEEPSKPKEEPQESVPEKPETPPMDTQGPAAPGGSTTETPDTPSMDTPQTPGPGATPAPGGDTEPSLPPEPTLPPDLGGGGDIFAPEG